MCNHRYFSIVSDRPQEVCDNCGATRASILKQQLAAEKVRGAKLESIRNNLAEFASGQEINVASALLKLAEANKRAEQAEAKLADAMDKIAMQGQEIARWSARAEIAEAKLRREKSNE